MKPTSFIAPLLLSLLGAFSTAQATPTAGTVEPLLVYNARGLTLNAAGTLQRFQALAIDDHGRVLATGSLKALRALAPKARRIDAQGQVLMPGLSDAHGHVMRPETTPSVWPMTWARSKQERPCPSATPTSLPCLSLKPMP